MEHTWIALHCIALHCITSQPCSHRLASTGREPTGHRKRRHRGWGVTALHSAVQRPRVCVCDGARHWPGFGTDPATVSGFPEPSAPAWRAGVACASTGMACLEAGTETEPLSPSAAHNRQASAWLESVAAKAARGCDAARPSHVPCCREDSEGCPPRMQVKQFKSLQNGVRPKSRF